MDISLQDLPGGASRDDFALYSESQGRLVVTVNPEYQDRFEGLMQGNQFAQIGTIREDERFVVRGTHGRNVINTDLNSMEESYKSTFKDY